MSHIITVSLDTSVTPAVLELHDHGHVHVDRKSIPQTITWRLTGVLTQGTFTPINGPDPGFEWVSDPAPPKSVFSAPVPGAHGLSMSIIDHHTSSSSDGSWIYALRVVYQGTIYCTTSSLAGSDTVKDPIIINH